jgi:uncharacterized protein
MKRPFLLLAAAILLPVGALFGAGEYLSKPARHSVGSPPPGLSATPVSIANGTGRVAGWFLHGTRSGAILLLHGVRADRRQMIERAHFLHRNGYSVLLVDLPAHGESSGERITFGAHEAQGVQQALAWLRHARPGEKIGVIGASLGGAALLLAAPGEGIDALVLEAVYPTIEEAVHNRLARRAGPMASALAPLLLQQIPLRTGVQLSALRPVEAIAKAGCPVMVLGGALDEHTTAEETRRLFGAAPEPKQLWVVEGAAHVDLHAFDPRQYERSVGDFLDRALKP